MVKMLLAKKKKLTPCLQGKKELYKYHTVRTQCQLDYLVAEST